MPFVRACRVLAAVPATVRVIQAHIQRNTTTLDPHRDLIHRHRFGIRTLTIVSSDQLGFVPDPLPQTDVPIANADDRKISILWSPQNWSRLYVSS